uniref:Macaca fascicularis brain cDNA clone: QflA-19618, similar to human HMBA-inducible (HIS1), mRNA, RefSeq: NM_006460.1 n=1 Tax=Macaca fascicularis TaxID=9541 RepID=I7GLW5_MACFA|nr:unnamed protein product [Macaca fascicularis]
MGTTCPLAATSRRRQKGNRSPRPSCSPSLVMTPRPVSWGLLPQGAKRSGDSSRDSWARKNIGDARPRRSGIGNHTTS